MTKYIGMCSGGAGGGRAHGGLGANQQHKK
jgi:hypothetical protein